MERIDLSTVQLDATGTVNQYRCPLYHCGQVKYYSTKRVTASDVRTFLVAAESIADMLTTAAKLDKYLTASMLWHQLHGFVETSNLALRRTNDDSSNALAVREVITETLMRSFAEVGVSCVASQLHILFTL